MIRRVFLKTLSALTGLFVAKTDKPADKPLVLTDSPEDVVRIQAAFSGLLLEMPKSEGHWSCKTHLRMLQHQNTIMVCIDRHYGGCSWRAGISLRSDFVLRTSMEVLLCVETLKHAIRACEVPLATGQYCYKLCCCEIQKIGDEQNLVLQPIPDWHE